MGNDFFYHFCCAIGSIWVAATYKFSDTSLQFVAEDELDVVIVVSKLFRIVSFYSAFLVAYHVDHAAVDINGDDFELALLLQRFEDLDVNFSLPLGCFVAEVSKKIWIPFPVLWLRWQIHWSTDHFVAISIVQINQSQWSCRTAWSWYGSFWFCWSMHCQKPDRDQSGQKSHFCWHVRAVKIIRHWK